MTLIISRSRGRYLKMSRLLTPSTTFPSSDAIGVGNQNDNLAANDDGDIIARNRLAIIELEEKYILNPGILTVDPSGQLKIDLSNEEPDQGTMVGLYPGLPPPEGYEPQIPSWLRDFLIKELNLFGNGPPSACGSLWDQMVRSREIGAEGTNLSVSSAALLLSCGVMSLRESVADLRDFCSSGDPVCEDTYEMEFGIVERVIKRIAGWHPSQSVQNRLLASVSSKKEGKEQSPAKRRKITESRHVDVAAPAEQELPRDIALLLNIGSQGMVMKGVLDSSLEDLVITPVSRLIDKLDTVEKALRRQEEEDCKKENRVGGGDHYSDSGVSACSP
ncbi:hypothetical protein KVR01_002722 [Diaporthe batatas]|uniref:uncharacterized protein n=1 Tax=Diaporthe batatas TaxID=748121 RepID=UPI001D0429A7|nr:uncharacterized protein KVR01_002722 [Diaporthe batatas]KAG8167033.1 hypothetical protein KVR01_002722 [Diaporthe batatas]